MNTFAFGEELADVDATAGVESVNLTSATMPSQVYYEGLKYTYDAKTGEYKTATTIKYASNGDKKNPVNNVVTIEGVDNPVSWNNHYATDLLEVVLGGTDRTDEYLNNSKKLTISENDEFYDHINDDNYNSYEITLPDGYRQKLGYAVYKVIPLADEGYYLFMSYDLDGIKGMVEGADDYDENEKWFKEIPIATWDGTKIDFNKSGLFKVSKSKSEALNVRLALVKYENGSVTEIPGVTVASAKIDKKAIAQASVSGNPVYTQKTYTRKYNNETYTYNELLQEYKVVNGATLPTFTITAKVTGKNADAKKEKKNIATALKTEKYTFAIRRALITVNDIHGKFSEAYYDNGKTISPNKAEELLEKEFSGDAYDSSVDRDYQWLGSLRVSKFNGKKATMEKVIETYNGKKDGVASIKLKDGKEYKLASGSLAGETVAVLDIPETSNYEYNLGSPYIYWHDGKWSDDGKTWTDTSTIKYSFSLAAQGYKYAFRQSPKDKKMIRKGIYKDTNNGFVYSED